MSRVASIDRILRSNLKLKHLQLLVALDEFRHLGRVAEFLRVTQPAVSKSLAEIEKLFELDLFSRSPRGTEPTAYGDKVVRFARSVLADYARTLEDLDAVTRGSAGHVKVGAMVVAIPTLLSGALIQLKAASAKTTVFVEEGDLTRLLPRLRVGELDLIIGRLEPGYASPDLETEPLYTETMSVVAHPAHPLCAKRKPGWADLARETWVVPPSWASSRVKLNQLFYKHKQNPPTDVIETASFLTSLILVRERQSLGFLAHAVARHYEQEGLLRILPVTVPIDLPPVGLIMLTGAIRTPSTQQLIDCLRQVGAQMTETSIPNSL